MIGYKHTALGWIPEEWEIKKIKDIAKITSGTTPLRSVTEYHTAGSIPWVKTTDLNNSVILETEEKVTDLALKETSLRIYPKGTVLVAMYGGFNQIGRTGLLGIEAAINQALSAITVDCKKTDQKFLLDWLNGKVGLWKTFAGSSRKDPNITSNDVGDFPIIDIPFPEQRKIAAVLSTWDKAIAAERALISALQSRHRALMQRLLSGRVRLKGFEGEWKHHSLGEVAHLKVGKTPSRSNEEYWMNPNPENIWISIADMKRGVLLTSKEKLSDLAVKECRPNKVAAGTLLMSFKLTLGKMAWAGKDLFTNEAIVAIYPEKKKVYDKLLFYILPFAVKKSDAGEAVKGRTLNQEHLQNLSFKLPSLAEQHAIAQILATSEREISVHKAQLAALQSQKKGLMQVLLTGKKRVNYISAR